LLETKNIGALTGGAITGIGLEGGVGSLFVEAFSAYNLSSMCGRRFKLNDCASYSTHKAELVIFNQTVNFKFTIQFKCYICTTIIELQMLTLFPLYLDINVSRDLSLVVNGTFQLYTILLCFFFVMYFVCSFEVTQ
jgi:hypothetical protein